ncbi:MAG TPA: 4-alpha-glucanotransferase [Thermoanaerobaculia bacterium]|nr:4-alpha-glucanotransferase [Thermoanaerobaculia bacterium]
MTHTSNPGGRDARRTAGVLLHPTSLPGTYGIGDLGDELTVFLDWAASAGITIWQVLPLNPTGYGNSPYNCVSSVAGNPMLISPQRLLQDQLLTSESIAGAPKFAEGHVDFDRVVPWKYALLREAFTRFDRKSAAFDKFQAEEREWLDDFALYTAIQNSSGGQPWWTWDGALAHREAAAIKKVQKELREEITFRKFLQFVFFRQWRAAREAARTRGIRIMGDVPIYVAHDSADVWANRELFQIDDRGQPIVVAGVPPDYFSSTGQRWGNPIYRWDVLRETHYRWWITRIRTNLELADMVRLDHFRGFAAYWEVPASESTAIHGRWMPGPGLELFDAIRDALGDLPLIAEDLGFITPEVDQLRDALGFAGMKILQFGFSVPDSPHLPHRFRQHTVVYTGTHDNDTAGGWFEHAPEDEREEARMYLGEECTDIAWALIRAAYTSVAETAIVPVQDILGLGSDARMNRPGAGLDNWSWRLRSGSLTRALAQRLRKLGEITGRI